MKTPLALSILILCVACYDGWRSSRRVTVLQAESVQLQRQLAEMSSARSGDGGRHSTGPTSSARAKTETASPEKIASLTERLRNMITARNIAIGNRQAPDEAAMREQSDLMTEIAGLDLPGLKMLLEAAGSPDPSQPELPLTMARLVLKTMGRNYPEAALAKMTELPEKSSSSLNWLISEALAELASRQPSAAVDWLKANGEKFPNLRSSAACRLIEAVAKDDPILAFSLTAELGSPRDGSMIQAIVERASTPDQRSALLAAMRERFKESPSDSEDDAAFGKHVFALVGAQVSNGSFKEGVEWLNSHLSEEEQQAAAVAMNPWGAERREWTEWSLEKTPETLLKTRTRILVQQWVGQDWQGAADWLKGRPDGPVAEAGIISFVNYAGFQQPATSAELLERLPQGDDRTTLAKRIWQNWKYSDPKAAADFAKAQGLTE